MELKEYNELQIKVIIDFYKSYPNTEELCKWVSLYAKKFKDIIDLWFTDCNDIEKMLYEQNKRV